MSQAGGSRGLDEGQRAALERALKSLHLGDAEGRRIFLLALGYELAELAPQIAERLAEPPPPPVEQPPFCSEIESRARSLEARIAGLGADERELVLERLNEEDRFGHGFDSEYLDSLRSELARLAGACSSPEPPPPPDPASDPAVQRLVALIAKAYDECFESVPGADIHGPFARLLATVFREVGLDLPVTSRLIQAGLEPENRGE